MVTSTSTPNIIIWRSHSHNNNSPLLLLQPVEIEGSSASVSATTLPSSDGRSSFVVTAQDLEELLTQRITVNTTSATSTTTSTTTTTTTTTKDDEQQQQQQQQQHGQEEQLDYMTRYDVHWLQIDDQPPNYELTTILGVVEDRPNKIKEAKEEEKEEEDVEDVIARNILVDVTCFELFVVASSDENKDTFTDSVIGGPHHEWKRYPNITDENENHLAYSPAPDSPLQQLRQSLWWMDLRVPSKQASSSSSSSSSQPLLSNSRDVIQLLRSILTSSHSSSPWVQKQQQQQQPQTDSSSLPDMVVLVLNDDKDDNSNDNSRKKGPVALLKEFRVSDVAPSWFLHAITHMDNIENDSNTLFGSKSNGVVVGRQVGGTSTTTTTSPATVFIYKRLGKRSALSTTHPTTKRSTGVAASATTSHNNLPDGCLWEAYNKPGGEDDEDNNDLDDDEEEEKKDSKSSSTDNNNGDDDNADDDDTRSYRPVCPPYISLEQDYPSSIFEELFSPTSTQVFLQDALSIPQWTPWPETAHYRVSSDNPDAKPWTVFPLCHCFPANDPNKFTWVQTTKSFVPNTCELLQRILGGYLRTALFSQLAPHSVLEAHTGWADLANHVLRLHIPLVVPCEEEGLCGTWVDGCVETHCVGRPLLFDDSKIHRAFNYSDETRIVLIVDLARPNHLPIGTATGGHSDELDAFIQQMGMPR